MRIEMVGPPTSGKSTVVKALQNAGIKRGKKASPEEVPKHWEPFADFIKKTYKDTKYQKLLKKTLSSLATAWVGDCSKFPKIHDELVIICGISMAIRLPKEYADKYFSEVPLPSLLINLTASNETLLKRNLLREERSRPRKTHRAIKACQTYVPFLEKRGCQILTFNTETTPLPEIIHKVVEKKNDIS